MKRSKSLLFGGCASFIAAIFCGLTGLSWLIAEHPDGHGHIIGGERARLSAGLVLVAFLLGAVCIYLLVEALNARAKAQQEPGGEGAN